MKNLVKHIVLCLILGLMANVGLAQHEEEKKEHLFRNERKNIVMFSFGYTYLPDGSALHHGESEGIFVPSIGLDYKRRVSEKWALSLFTDIEMDHYILIDKEFERENAFIAVVGPSYEITRGLGSFAGAGVEFEKSQNLFVMRLGLEYAFDLGHHWIMVPQVFVDWKESYGTYSFSVGISRKF